MRAWLAVVLVVAAGCLGSGPGGPSGTTTSTDPPVPVCTPQDAPVEPMRGDGFDGAAALAWVEAIVYEAPDVLRPRIPVDDEATCTAAWLGKTLAVPGWQVAFDNFTTADYRNLSKGAAGPYTDRCSGDDAQELESTRFHNVYAVHEGGDRSLLLAAHWDQKEDAADGGVVPGANDGASGMGLLLELQRHIAAEGLTFPFDIVIAFFDGEDGFEDCHPLAGSLHFAQTMPVPVDRMILLDMVGDVDARFPREVYSVDADPELVDLIWERAPDHGLAENFIDNQRPVIDDHRPFIDVGVPAVDIIDYGRTGFGSQGGFPPYWHTSEDTPDQLEASMLGSMGSLLVDVLEDPRFVETWPR